MKPIKVIGIGSPFGQDQAGWQIIELLENQLSFAVKQYVELLETDRPGMQLLELLKHTDYAILIDAIDNPQCESQIVKLDKSELLILDKPFSSHSLGVSEALRLGQALHQLPGELVLFGICINPEKSSLLNDKSVMLLGNEVLQTINNIISVLEETEVNHA